MLLLNIWQGAVSVKYHTTAATMDLSDTGIGLTGVHPTTTVVSIFTGFEYSRLQQTWNSNRVQCCCGVVVSRRAMHQLKYCIDDDFLLLVGTAAYQQVNLLSCILYTLTLWYHNNLAL